MSMSRCKSCDRFVDTDDDPDCYWHSDSGLEEWDDCMCEGCRDDQPEAHVACSVCSGTGIGQHGDPDTSRCYACKGRGYYGGKVEPDPDDERDRRMDDRLTGFDQ